MKKTKREQSHNDITRTHKTTILHDDGKMFILVGLKNLQPATPDTTFLVRVFPDVMQEAARRLSDNGRFSLHGVEGEHIMSHVLEDGETTTLAYLQQHVDEDSVIAFLPSCSAGAQEYLRSLAQRLCRAGIYPSQDHFGTFIYDSVEMV